MSLFVCFYCLIGWVGASRGLSRKVMFLVTNYRIFLTRRTSCHAENHGWSRMSVMNFLFYHELSNYRIFFTRSVAEGHGFFFLSRIVGFFSSHGVSRKVTGVLLFSDYRIVSSHGMTRKVTNYRIIEFSSHGLSRKVTDFYHELSRLVLGPTDQREVIIELFLHT